MIFQAMAWSSPSSTGWETLLHSCKCVLPRQVVSFEFHTRQWHQASRGHASHRAGHCHVPSGPAPFLYTEKWPHCKKMPCPSLPQGSPGPLHVPASQVSPGFTYVVGKMKTQYFFQLGNLDYALQSLFATWFEGSAVPLGSRRGGADGSHEGWLLSWSFLHRAGWTPTV